MKINIEDYLHKIDLALKEKSKKDIQMIYIMVAAGIFAFAYLLFWDSSFDKFEKTRKSVISLQNKIAQNQSYLQMHPESMVVQLDTQIQKLQKDVEQLKAKNQYIKNKIETIPFLIYDAATWGEYLDSITTNAQKYGVKIDTLENNIMNNQDAFGHVLDVHIQGFSTFKNMLKFINSLEKADLVIDLHDFNISSQDHKMLFADLNLSVWGIKY